MVETLKEVPVTGAEPRAMRRVRAFALDVAAIASIPLAGFANFVVIRGYDPTRPEVLLAVAWILLMAAVLAGVIALRPDSLRPIVFVVLVTTFLQMQGGIALPQWIDQWLLGVGGQGAVWLFRWALYIVPLSILFFVMRDKLSLILSVTFGVIALSGLVLPHAPPKDLTVVQREVPSAAGAAEKPPLLLHLILDQQIGIDGLPPEVDGTPQLRQALTDFYRDNGFRLYPEAFTHFPATVESIPDLLNGALQPSSGHFIGTQNDKVQILKNAWFEELARRGYDIEVVQSDYIDYCHDEALPISYCATVMASDIRDIADLNLAVGEKTTLLLYTFFDEDFGLLARMSRIAWHSLQQLTAKAGLALLDWDRRAMAMSPISALTAMDLLAARAAEAGPGTALFAHLLLPHDPYILSRDCRVKADLQAWHPRESAMWWHRVKSDPQRRLARYEAYYDQVLCLHRRLAALLDSLARRGLLENATVIVHGDHGSRLSLIEPITGNEGLMTSRDVIDSVSTLFAIRGPDIDPGLVQGQRSIQALFAALALGKEVPAESLDFYLKDPVSIVGPKQKRLPLVPFKDD